MKGGMVCWTEVWKEFEKWINERDNNPRKRFPDWTGRYGQRAKIVELVEEQLSIGSINNESSS